MPGEKPGLAGFATSRMTPWQQFYQTVRDPSWPDCEQETDFESLPDHVRQEIISLHGYHPGEYKQRARLPHRKFPIESATACQLKWSWSTVFLTTGETASCHRTNHHRFDAKTFDFHNTPQKKQDRSRMLQGLWPEKGCDYCQNIERAGGQSDRITNLDLAGIHAPSELDTDLQATSVTPRILEVYFDNLCNLKCVYCGPHFSSLWDAENKRHGPYRSNGLIISDDFQKDVNIEQNKQRLFDWMRENACHLTNFNILGGEPLFQSDFDRCLEFFSQHPAPDLDLQIFSNLNATAQRVGSVIQKVRQLINRGNIRQFTVTASLDCWGPEAEYARFPLNLTTWQSNFEMLLAEPWIKLVVGSTITPLTIKTFPDLVARLNHWRQIRDVHHYFNSVNGPSYLFIDVLGPVFQADFQKALDIMPNTTLEHRNVRGYLQGIALQSSSGAPRVPEVKKLRTFLDELDRRRHTDWQKVYPWLVTVFADILDGRPTIQGML
jgi:hypothetical protein